MVGKLSIRVGDIASNASNRFKGGWPCSDLNAIIAHMYT